MRRLFWVCVFGSSVAFGQAQHPYTRMLLSAAPSARAERMPGDVIEATGDPPSPINPPSGCRFRTRCPFAFDRCTSEEPPLYEIGPQHRSACHLVTESRSALKPPLTSSPQSRRDR